MGIFFALLAGLFMPLTNLTVRKSVDVGGTSKGYFVFQMLSSFLFAVLIGPIWNGNYTISLPSMLLGIAAGLVLSLMLYTVGRSVEKGPPGFTFAILNSATVMPGLLMALFLGARFGYEYKLWHALGSGLVLIGLFWGAKGLEGMKDRRQWAFFALSMFLFHVLLLALYQWRGMLLSENRPEGVFSFFSLEKMANECFTPFMFFTSGIVQLIIYLRAENRMPMAGEVYYGFAGGLSNLLCTFCLLAAAVKAGPLENAVIFPVFSVIGIILTNAWGQALYQEQVNWRACQVCAFGLILGTVDWKGVAAAIGF